MNSSQKGGKSKSSSYKSKKGGNFLGSVSELFVPTGWESFATAAGLLAIDRADAAFRRSRNSSKKQKGGADADGHETFQYMEGELDKLQKEPYNSTPDTMNGGGGPKKNLKSKTKSKKPAAKKPAAKKPASKSKAKGGNFLGAVGDLVAPTGWGPFATAAGLFALDRADAALRRGTKEKKEKMKGGVECRVNSHSKRANPIQFDFSNILSNTSENKRNKKFFSNYYSVRYKLGFDDIMTIYFVNNPDNKIDLKIEATINGLPYSHCLKYNFESEEKAKNAIDNKMKLNLGKLVLKEYAREYGKKLGNGVFNIEA
jgi:hypothetical protein